MDFYIVLGLERDATLGEIKRAYKRLARRYHPDINPGDRMASAHFRQIAEAYETLSDPDRRRRYDATGRPMEVPEASFGFEGFDFSVSVGGMEASTFGDLFADVLGAREPRRQDGPPERGADLQQSLTLEFEDALRGGERSMAVTRLGRCRTCRGSGWLQVEATACAACQGSGIVKSARGHMVFSRPCDSCGGTGQHQRARCPTCAGHQTEMRTEPVVLNIPPGIADGAQIRLTGRGHVGRHGGENGDLVVMVYVRPHPVFRREGDDLHVIVPVAVHEAALGARIEVPSLEGPVRLRVPAGTQSGQRLRLRERGAPAAGAAPRGDLVIEIRLVLPAVLDERSKELLREFGQINSEDVRRQ